MEDQLKKRVLSFLWGMGGFVVVATCTYLMNISNIQDIDWNKLATIVITVASGYVVNQVTKYLNN